MWRQMHPHIEWAMLLGLWMGAGVGVAIFERTVTAGVIGANIGGGILMLASPVAVIGILGISAAILWPLRRDDRAAGG